MDLQMQECCFKMSKWRNDFEVKMTIENIKKAVKVKDMERGISDVITEVIQGKHQRRARR